MIEAIFFDVDGTLLSFHSHQIDQEVFDTFDVLKKKGIKLFIASGRSKNGLHVLNNYPFDGYIINNGQCCYDENWNLFSENTICKEDLEIIISEANRIPFPCGFTMPDGKIFNYRDERVDAIHIITKNDNHPSGDVSDIVNKKVYQAMAFLDEDQEKELVKKLKKCESSRWHPSFCDINSLGSSKAEAMKIFAKKHGFAMENVMAFGDGGNDASMLESAGIGVAMLNGSDSCKECADYVTLDVDEGGVMHALKHFKLI